MSNFKNSKIIFEKDINKYIEDNPTHYLFDQHNSFIFNLFNKAYTVTSEGLSRYNIDITKLMTRTWVVLEPVNFVDAVRAWDAGKTIIGKSSDLLPPVIYHNYGGFRTDISFDGVDILVKQWFVVQ